MDTTNGDERSPSMGRVLGKRAIIYIGLLVFVFALVLILNTSNASAGTVVPAGNTGTQTWDTVGSPYWINGNVVVQTGATLTIDPGVNVLFNGSYSITVDGRLNATGGSGTSQGINFTSNFAGNWDGLYFTSSGSQSRLRNVLVDSATNGIVIQDTTMSLFTSIRINNAAGTALSMTRTTLDYSVSLTNIIVDTSNNGILIQALAGNVSASLVDCIVADVNNVGVLASGRNATLTVDGGLYTAPVALMTVALEASGVYSSTVNVVDTSIYDSALSAGAISTIGSATATITNCRIGNVPGGFAAAAIAGVFGQATVNLNSVSLENVTVAAYASANLGNAVVNLNDVDVTNAFVYDVYATSNEGGATVNMNNVLFNHTGSFGVYAIANKTVTVGITNSLVNDTMEAVYAFSVNGGTVLSVTNSNFTNMMGVFDLYALGGNLNVALNGVVADNMLGFMFGYTTKGAQISFSDVTVTNAYQGVELEINNSATISLTDVLMEGPNLVIGFWADIANGGATVTLTGVEINLYAAPDFNWYFAQSDYNAFRLDANQTVTLTVNGFLSNYGYDGLRVTTVVGNIIANIENFAAYTATWNSIRLLSGGSLSLTLQDLYINYTYWNNWWVGETAIYAWSMTGTTVQAANVVTVNAANGMDFGASSGDVVADIATTTMTTETSIQTPTWDVYMEDGITIQAVDGSADVTLTDVIVHPGFNEGWDVQHGIYVYANESITFSATNVESWLQVDGIYVWSEFGDIDATLNGFATVGEIVTGAAFYAPNGMIDLSMTDGLVVLPDGAVGIVAQCALDLTVMLDTVNVQGPDIGVELLTTDGELMLTVVDTNIMDCFDYGLRAIASNGGINANVDPSWFFDDDVGLYLDAALVANLWVNDSKFENNTIGIEVHGAEGVNIWLSNDVFLNSTEYGLFADADSNDLNLVCTECTFTNNWFGIQLFTETMGDIYVNVDNTTFELGYIGLDAEAIGDVYATIVDSNFLGQHYSGVELWSGHDTTVTVLRTTFDGAMAQDQMLFNPFEVDDEYIMIDPDGYTTADWMLVDLHAGWNFQFNGGSYTQVLMSKKGWIAFGAADPDEIYWFGPSSPNLVAAAQWDWESTEYPGIGYKYDAELDAMIFQWYVWDVDRPQLRNVFEILLFNDTNDIEIRYAVMEDWLIGTYDYGINFAGSNLNWNLWLWSPYIQDNAWRSVHFNMIQMSDGHALGSWAMGNITATVVDSHVSHYMRGGILLNSLNGWIDINIATTDFTWIASVDDMYEAALSAVEYNGTMNIVISGLEFSYIPGVALFLADMPLTGGSDSFQVVDNTFNEVMICSAILTMVETDVPEGVYTLTTTKVVARNLGTHVGPFITETIVNDYDPASSWTVVATETIEDNVLSGNVNPWFQMLFGIGAPAVAPMQGPEMGMLTSFVEVFGGQGETSITHTVSVTNNIIVDAPWGYFYPDAPAQPGSILAGISILDLAVGAGTGGVSSVVTIDIEGNEISAPAVPFTNAITVWAGQSLTSPEASTMDMVVSLTVVDNFIDVPWWYGYLTTQTGLYLNVYQFAEGGQGTVTLSVDVVVEDNTIWGAYDGVYILVQSRVHNAWSTNSMDANVQVRNNDLEGWNDALVVWLISAAQFEHYFPPFEQNVTAAASLTFLVDVVDNYLYGGSESVDVETDVNATCDAFGVFNTATAELMGAVNVLNNYIYGGDVFIGSDVAAYVGQATATAELDYTVMNNVFEYDSIHVETVTVANTLPLRYWDTPTATTNTNIVIQNNSEYGGPWDGIVVDQGVFAGLGMSEAMLVTTVDVMQNNITEAEYYGILVDIWAETNPYDIWWNTPYAAFDATVNVIDNMVTGDYWDYDATAIEVDIGAAWDDYWADVNGVATITENTISDAYKGIYAWSEPIGSVYFTIDDNLIDTCGFGIIAESAYFEAERNQVTNVGNHGIWLIGASGTIMDNLVTGMAGEAPGGIVISNDDGYYGSTDLISSDVWVENNDLMDLGTSGIAVENANDLTIIDNDILNAGDGIAVWGSLDEEEQYTSYDMVIENNRITNVAANGIVINDVDGLTVKDNVVSNAGEWGIMVFDSMDMEIWVNTLSQVSGGISLVDCMDGLVTENLLSTSEIKDGDGGETPEDADAYYGIFIEGCYNIMVTNHEVTGFENGVGVYDSDEIWFQAVIVTMSQHNGGDFDYVSNLMIMDCVFSNSGWNGLTVDESYNVMIADTEVNGNGLNGLTIINSSTVTVQNGMYINNGEWGMYITNPTDFVVTEVSKVQNNDVLFAGDVTVASEGWLELNLVDFIIIGDYRDGLSVITVEEGGMLNAMDTCFWFSYYDGNLTSDGMGYYYEFNVLGALEFVNVDLEDALELYLGPTSTANIMTSWIMYNERNGIHIDGCAPVIMSSQIVENPRNGIYIENGANPKITDCMIADNTRGIYAVGASIGEITDNVFALNGMAGIMAEQVTGAIHDNVFLLNNKEIYVKDSTVDIYANQIGYSMLVDVIAQFAPLLGLVDMDSDIFLPSLGLWISPDLLVDLMLGHIGVFAINSEVTTYGNNFGMLTTAVQVVNSELSFNDDILSRTLTLPYMDAMGIVRNMSLPIPVYDGIIAIDSDVTVNGGTIKVLDDAIFLDNCAVVLSSVTLDAGDFAIYAMGGTTGTARDVTIVNGRVGIVDGTTPTQITVRSTLTVMVEDPWGTGLANVPVTVKNAQGTTVAEGDTDATGAFKADIVSYVYTSSGKDYGMHPYSMHASYADVDTSGYPGHDAEFSPVEVTKSQAIPEPMTVVIQTNMIIKYNLAAKVTDPNGMVVPGAHVTMTGATGTTYSGTTNADGIVTALVVSYIQTPTGKDSSMQPYDVAVDFPMGGMAGYNGWVRFNPASVSQPATVESDMTTMVKTGIDVYYTLTVTAKDHNNKSTVGVYILVRDAAGNGVADGPTGESGIFVTDATIGWSQSADGTKDVSMNPYKVESAWDNGPGDVTSVDMSGGDMSVVAHQHWVPTDWALVISILAIAAIIIGVALFVVAGRND